MIRVDSSGEMVVVLLVRGGGDGARRVEVVVVAVVGVMDTGTSDPDLWGGALDQVTCLWGGGVGAGSYGCDER